VRRAVQHAAICVCASIAIVSAQPAAGVSQRTVTIVLGGNGMAFWKLVGSRETSRLSLDYHWHGTLSFNVAPATLTDPKHRKLSASSTGTLVAAWDGRYRSKKGDSVATCTYRGARVRARVTARLARGRGGNTIELTLHPRADGQGFFPDAGRHAGVRCSAGYMQSVPPHFAPSWFFRDNLQDHGRLSSETAVIVLPSALLPGGSVTVAFPSERGRNDSVGLGHLAWNNQAKTTVGAR
jgi:hypothetical protein